MFHSLHSSMEISPALGQRQVKVYPILVETLLHGQKKSLWENVASCHMKQKLAEMPVLLKQVKISRWISVKSGLWSWSLGPWSWAVWGDTPWSWPETPVRKSHRSWCCVTAVLLLTLAHHQRCDKQKWCCGKVVFITSWEDVTLCNEALWSPQRTVLGWCQPLLHSVLIPYAERTQITLKHYHYEAIDQFGQLTYMLPSCFSWQGGRDSEQTPPHLTYHPRRDHYWGQEQREVPPSPEI